jgi:hypothetical protein
MFPAYLWLLTRVLFCCTRGRGCTGHPVFPAPSDLLRDVFQAQLGRIPPREGGGVSATDAACSLSAPAIAATQ